MIVMAEIIELRASRRRPRRHATDRVAQLVDLAAARAERQCAARAAAFAAPAAVPFSPFLVWTPLVALWASLWVAPFGLRVEAAAKRPARAA
jgi:hypothetical protein